MVLSPLPVPLYPCVLSHGSQKQWERTAVAVWKAPKQLSDSKHFLQEHACIRVHVYMHSARVDISAHTLTHAHTAPKTDDVEGQHLTGFQWRLTNP